MPRTLTGILLTLLSLLPLSWRVSPQLASFHQSVAQAQTQEPVVHAVLFWIKGCPNCAEVLDNTLPSVQSQYGSRLDVRLVEVVTAEDVDRLYQIGSAYGLSKKEIGVPLLLLGKDVLVGSDEIPADFASLVDQYLTAGGASSPDLDQLASPLAASISAEGQQFNGMSLAWIIMVGMLVALVYTGWQVTRSFQGKPFPPAPKWFNLAIPILSLVGLGVALYLTLIESTSIPAVCGPIGDCNTVQQSSYARLFGVIPVGLLGAVGYLAILAAWAWQKARKDGLAGYVPLALFGMSLFGTLFSVYLTYLELFVIRAVCIWCLSSAVIITLLMLVSLPAASLWLAASEEEDQ